MISMTGDYLFPMWRIFSLDAKKEILVRFTKVWWKCDPMTH